MEYSQQCASEGKQALIRADGPYGNLSFNYHRYGSLVLVGGGIGITPIISVLKDVYGSEQEHNKRGKISHCIRVVSVVWIMPHKSEATLFLDLLMQYRQRSMEDPSLPLLNVSMHITRDEDPLPCEKMPIYFSKPIFSEVIDSCIDCKHVDSSSILVYTCGPGSMVNQLWDASMKRNSKKLRVDFYHESFEF